MVKNSLTILGVYKRGDTGKNNVEGKGGIRAAEPVGGVGGTPIRQPRINQVTRITELFCTKSVRFSIGPVSNEAAHTCRQDINLMAIGS